MENLFNRIPTDRGGYSLLELLVSASILIVMLNLCMSLYLSFNTLSRNSAAAVDANGRIAELDVVFRETVRNSAERRDAFQDFNATDSLLILENSAKDEVVLLGVLGESGVFSVARYVREEEDWALSYLKSYSLKSAEYRFDASKSPTIAFTIDVDNDRTRHTLPGTNTLLATLRQGGAR